MLLAQDVHAWPQRGEASFVMARKGPNLPRSATFDLERHFPSFGSEKSKSAGVFARTALVLQGVETSGTLMAITIAITC